MMMMMTKMQTCFMALTYNKHTLFYLDMDIYSRYTHAVQDSRMRLASLVCCFCTWVVENRSKLWTASRQPHFTNHTVKEEPSRGLLFQMQLKPREHRWLQRPFVFLLRKHLNNFLHTSRDLPIKLEGIVRHVVNGKKIRTNSTMHFIIMHTGCRSANILTETTTSQNHRAEVHGTKQFLEIKNDWWQQHLV